MDRLGVMNRFGLGRLPYDRVEAVLLDALKDHAHAVVRFANMATDETAYREEGETRILVPALREAGEGEWADAVEDAATEARAINGNRPA